MDPLAREALLHAVEREVVGVFADDDVGEQTWPGESLLDHRSVRAVATRRYHDATLLARACVLDPRGLHAHERRRAIVELHARLLANPMHRIAATCTLSQCLGRMDFDTLDWQVSGQLVAAVRPTTLALVALLALTRFILGGGDLLGQSLRHDERGDLAEGHLHLVGVDALALVLRPQVALDPLELQQHQLVELAVLVALVRRARQLRLQLRDARRSVVGHGCFVNTSRSAWKEPTVTASRVPAA